MELPIYVWMVLNFESAWSLLHTAGAANNSSNSSSGGGEGGGSCSDLDRQIEQLRRCEVIRETEVKALCAKAREILVEESNVQRVDSPVTVCILVPLCVTRATHSHSVTVTQ